MRLYIRDTAKSATKNSPSNEEWTFRNGVYLYRNLFQYLSSAPYLQNFNWLQTRVRKLPNRVYFLRSRRRGMVRDSIVLLPYLLSLPLSVFSLKLHPPQKYHCSNIQNGDVHCGTLEWAQCGSCVAARACCDLQLIRDFFKICRTPKIKSRGDGRGFANRCACKIRYRLAAAWRRPDIERRNDRGISIDLQNLE